MMQKLAKKKFFLCYQQNSKVRLGEKGKKEKEIKNPGEGRVLKMVEEKKFHFSRNIASSLLQLFAK